MSDTPEGPRDSLPVSTTPQAKGRGSESAGGSGGQVAAQARDPGRPAPRAEATERTSARHRIGIRELRQHASVYVDLAEKGYTVDITNRGRLVAQLVPVREPGSPLERLIAAGIIEPAEEPGGVGDIEPYPAPGAPRLGAPRQDAPRQDAPRLDAPRLDAGEAPGRGRPEDRR